MPGSLCLPGSVAVSSLQQERASHREQSGSWLTAPAVSCETTASLSSAECKQAFSSVTGDVVGAHCLCKAHIRKKKSCYRVPAKGESCSDAVRQMVQVQISSPSHHNNLLLRDERMWIYCVRRQPQRARCFKTLKATFQEKNNLFSVINHGRKYCATTQVKFKKLHQYHHTAQTPTKRLGVTCSWFIKHPPGKVVSESTAI